MTLKRKNDFYGGVVEINKMIEWIKDSFFEPQSLTRDELAALFKKWGLGNLLPNARVGLEVECERILTFDSADYKKAH